MISERAVARAVPARPLISVVIPCFNQAGYLGEAIESALAQDYDPVEVVVVDDGSSDDTRKVAMGYPAVRYTYQPNRGLAAARNKGIEVSQASYFAFLDADDRLCQGALKTGLTCIDAHPECGFVYGRFRFIDERGRVLTTYDKPPDNSDDYIGLFGGNHIAMCAAVLYPRRVLEEVDGFRAQLRAAEDYDLYFRIARLYPFFRHSAVVAECRRHTKNMSLDSSLMLRSTLTVLRDQREHLGDDARRWRAYRASIELWKQYYGGLLVKQVKAELRAQHPKKASQKLFALLSLAPGVFCCSIGRMAGKMIRALSRLVTPQRGRVWSWRIMRSYAVRRLTPLSRDFGYDRGTPVDRYYIQGALAGWAQDIRGRVLEIKDNSYTLQFGGRRVLKSDVLDMCMDNPNATICADLAHGSGITPNTYDCVIATQTLHLIYDFQAAVRTLYRILKPGGVLLVSVPGISQIARDQMNRWSDQWRFTSASSERLFGDVFGAVNVSVAARGNVCAAISYLQGRAAEELSQAELEYTDPDYEVVIFVRAAKN
jgi:glycosyltransferase involved in cell wall biosynthesis